MNNNVTTENPQKIMIQSMQGGWRDFLEHWNEVPIMKRKLIVDIIENACP